MHAGDQAILDHFTKTRAKTIELWDEIPASWHDRTANGEEQNVAALFGHIAFAVDFWMTKCMKDGGDVTTINVQEAGAVRQALERTRDRLVKFFSADGGKPMDGVYERVMRDGALRSFVGRTRVLYLAQHESHHRGKIVLAIRQWGVSPQGVARIPFIPYET